MSKRPNWVIPVVVGVFALAIAVGGVMYVDRLGEDDVQLALVANQSIQPIQSASGQIGTTKLPDGSAMTMGPETRIWIPETFSQKSRVVKVAGTAQFDVKPGLTLPFRVVVNRNHIIATGTKFAAFADANVFKPLGLEVTHYHVDATRLVHNRALAYAARDGRWRIANGCARCWNTPTSSSRRGTPICSSASRDRSPTSAMRRTSPTWRSASRTSTWASDAR